ncbi:MAG: hypothetical protein M1828_002589 [Chrysothrix sp. TS-e1954]|nr:MAG: hypothetical protein M1828_002589 [Chrysothrix sp. TS-e1954]
MEEDHPIECDFADELQNIAGTPSNAKPAAYSQLLDAILSKSSIDRLALNVTAFLTSLLGSDRHIQGVSRSTEPLSIIASRPLLTTFIEKLKEYPANDAKIATAQAALNLVQPRVVSFEEQDSALKDLLAGAYEADEDYASSARTLDSISLDTSSRTVTDEDKARIWVRIARCHLEEDDPTSASRYINRAKNVLHNVKEQALRLQFQLAQARILDSRRQFLDASNAYHNISFEPLVDEDDRLQTLSAAITCVVLASAGPPRARVLAKLYKDDRAAQTEEFAILEKIFLDQVLTPEEVAAFAAKLKPHQLAQTADGSTVLDHAVLEHNLLSASHLYRNIGFRQLGSLLGVDGDRAEQSAAQMIEQGRLIGHIDQIDEVIFFDTQLGADKVQQQAQQSKVSTGQELRQWDANVQALAEEVERVTTMISTQFPDFYAENMAY